MVLFRKKWQFLLGGLYEISTEESGCISHLFFECSVFFYKTWLDLTDWMGIKVVYHINCSSHLILSPE